MSDNLPNAAMVADHITRYFGELIEFGDVLEGAKIAQAVIVHKDGVILTDEQAQAVWDTWQESERWRSIEMIQELLTLGTIDGLPPTNKVDMAKAWRLQNMALVTPKMWCAAGVNGSTHRIATPAA